MAVVTKLCCVLIVYRSCGVGRAWRAAWVLGRRVSHALSRVASRRARHCAVGTLLYSTEVGCVLEDASSLSGKVATSRLFRLGAPRPAASVSEFRGEAGRAAPPRALPLEQYDYEPPLDAPLEPTRK